MESSKIKTEYIWMVNDHHDKVMRNRKAKAYSDYLNEKESHKLTASWLIVLAVGLFCVAVLFGGGI